MSIWFVKRGQNSPEKLHHSCYSCGWRVLWTGKYWITSSFSSISITRSPTDCSFAQFANFRGLPFDRILDISSQPFVTTAKATSRETKKLPSERNWPKWQHALVWRNASEDWEWCGFQSSHRDEAATPAQRFRRSWFAEDLRGRPCSRHENLKMYTLFKTEDPENDTLTVGTSLPRKYMGVPPPPPPLPRAAQMLHSLKILTMSQCHFL